MGKVKVGIAGLGRLGKLHANNLAFKIPDAELTAACSIVPAELEYAKEQLGVADVYADTVKCWKSRYRCSCHSDDERGALLADRSCFGCGKACVFRQAAGNNGRGMQDSRGRCGTPPGTYIFPWIYAAL